MPTIRNRGNVHDGGYDWPERPAPSLIHWNPNFGFGSAMEPIPPTFPDVPLNPQHRYCTPPPLDPTLLEEPRPYEYSPQFPLRSPSPDEFDFELISDRPPSPVPGTRAYPIEVIDAPAQENIRPGQSKRPQVDADQDTPRRAPRTTSRPTASTTTSSSSSRRKNASAASSTAPAVSPSRTPARTRGAAPATSSSKTPARKRKPTTPTRRSPRTNRGAGGPATVTGANSYLPSNSSPLRNVAYRAPSERSLPPASSVDTQSRWYIPPRKTSTGSTIVTSESSDSESDDSDSSSHSHYL